MSSSSSYECRGRFIGASSGTQRYQPIRRWLSSIPASFDGWSVSIGPDHSHEFHQQSKLETGDLKHCGHCFCGLLSFLSEASNQEVLGRAAAYAAVMVVFVGSAFSNSSASYFVLIMSPRTQTRPCPSGSLPTFPAQLLATSRLWFPTPTGLL